MLVLTEETGLCRCRKQLCWEVTSGWGHLELARVWYTGLRTRSNVQFSTCFPQNARAVLGTAKLSRPVRLGLTQMNRLLQKAGVAPGKAECCLWQRWIYKPAPKDKARISSERINALPQASDRQARGVHSSETLRSVGELDGEGPRCGHGWVCGSGAEKHV